MHVWKNIPRFIREQYSPGNNNYDENAKIDGKISTVSSTSSSSALSSQCSTAAYLRNLPRPPFEDGMQSVTDPLFRGFCQGEIPSDHNERLQIAQTCIDYGFPSSLAWLFVKTGMSDFTYRTKESGRGLLTLGYALEYSELPLTSLVIEIKNFNTYDLEDIGSKLNASDSLKKIDFSTTVMAEYTFRLVKGIKGPNGDIVITGGKLEDISSSSSSFSIDMKLPATIFSQRWVEAASKGFREIHQKQAISAIENTRNFKLENFSEVQVPRISEFSSIVQAALKCFFRKCYEVPYFMLHTTFSKNMVSILSTGSLTSRARLEKFSGKPISLGLKDLNDVNNNEHRMIFASMGTNANNIRPPSTFEEVKKSYKCSSFLIDVDLFMQCNHSARKHMIVKSCDWGDSTKMMDKEEYVTQIINIPNTSTKIIRLGMDAKNGVINPDAMIRYRYENDKNQKTIEYALPVYGDIVTGVNYRQLAPLLLVQHLRQLSEEEQLTVLSGIINNKDGSAEQKHAVESMLEAFIALEISIPGSLPLQLEYVDLVEHDRQLFDFKALRKAVQQGQMDEFVVLMEKARYLPGEEAPDWLINGIHRIAMTNWLESGQQADRFLAILDFIEPRYQQIWLGRTLDYKPDYASLDLLKASNEINSLSVPPSRINLLILELSAKQEKVEAYLTANRNTALQGLNKLREVFNTKKDVSMLGFQSNLKAKVIGNNKFNEFVQNKDMIKSLVYLASAAPTLITKIFGEIDLKIFEAENGFTELDIIGNINGIKKINSQSNVNRSFLSELPSVFRLPVSGSCCLFLLLLNVPLLHVLSRRLVAQR